MNRYILIPCCFVILIGCGLFVFQNILSKALLSKQFWIAANSDKLNFVLKKYSKDNINKIVDKNGYGVAYYASIHGKCPQCISLLADKNVDFTRKFNGFSLLHIMCFRENKPEIEMIKSIVKAGVDVNAISKKYKSPALFTAIYFNKGERVVKTLIDLGADIHFRNDHYNGITPLIQALQTYNGQVDMKVIQILLTYGADPTLKDAHNKSALDYMALNEKIIKSQLFKDLLNKYQR